jgi:SSS family solute:Na+ symporter
MVIPTFLAKYLAPGVLGLVMCGLMASMMSAISADINSVATLFTNDIYHNIRRKVSQKHLLKVVRISTVVSGILMILIAHFVVSRFKGVVDAQLTFVGIVDMPVFVITIIYGLFSRRTNWQGAIGGYIVGATAGLMCYRYFSGNPDLSAYTVLSRYLGNDIHWSVWAKSIAALASTSGALIATPLVSMVFPKQKLTSEGQRILDAFKAKTTDGRRETADSEIHLWPVSGKGKFGVGLMALGALSFLIGVLSGSVQFAFASQLAVGGMLVFFMGGLVRVYSD